MINQEHTQNLPARSALTPAPGSDAEFQAELRQVCLHSAPEEIENLRFALQAFVKNTSDAATAQEFYRRTHSIAGNSGLAGLTVVANLAGTLELLVKELQLKLDFITPSVTRTLAQAVDGIARLFTQPVCFTDPQLGTGAVLVVDDEEIACRAVAHSLNKVKLTPTTCTDPLRALAVAGQHAFVLIVSDIEMPNLTGLEFCKKVRELPAHKKTPFMFVTTHTNFESRAQAVLSGGNDLIAKPFLFSELAVKALTLVVNHQLSQTPS